MLTRLHHTQYHDNRADDIIASSHKGAVITYIAPYFEDNGAAPIWTKIDEDGLDGTQWAVDKLIANKGKKDFTIPSDLKAGKYMSKFVLSGTGGCRLSSLTRNNTVRQEIIALHEADATFDQNPARGAQFYPACVQFDISGDGTAVPSENFAFNGGYSYSDPGIHFNLYGGSTAAYTIPGPKMQATLSAAKPKMRFMKR